MDLTEIMDFLDSLDECSTKNEDINDDLVTPSHELSPVVKAPKRNRANTWHGDYDDTSMVLSEMPSLDSMDNSPTNGTPPKGSLGQAIVSRKSIARRNAWGNLSYADMITQAINSSPEKRMTLSEIYNWMVQNIHFFKDKGESNSSAGWKNSIRHNLSLHKCFMRVQNDGAGKSSWWVLNPNYRVTQPQRRRAATMDFTKSPSLHQRVHKAKKTDQLTMPLADSTTADMSTKEAPDSFEESFKTRLEFRPRSKTMSHKFSKLSPTFEDQEETDHMYKKRLLKSENGSESFYTNSDLALSYQQQSPNTPNALNMPACIPIPTHVNPPEIKCGSLPTGWTGFSNNNYPVNKHLPQDAFSNNHSMHNIKAHLYAENNALSMPQGTDSRLLSGGNVVRRNMFRHPQQNVYERSFNNAKNLDHNNNNNNPHFKEFFTDKSAEVFPPSTKSLQMLMSGGIQVPPFDHWSPHYNQQQQLFHQQHQQQRPSKKDHALLVHLLTEKEHCTPEQTSPSMGYNRGFNSPQQYSSMLQHLLTAGHKRNPRYSNLHKGESFNHQYADSATNMHFQSSQQYVPIPSNDHSRQFDFDHPSMPYFSAPQMRHIASTSPPTNGASDQTDSPSKNINSDKYLSNSGDSHESSGGDNARRPFTKCASSTSGDPSMDIPEDLASIDSFFSDIDAGISSPCNIEMSISQVINLEKSLADPLEVDFMSDAFNFT